MLAQVRASDGRLFLPVPDVGTQHDGCAIITSVQRKYAMARPNNYGAFNVDTGSTCPTPFWSWMYRPVGPLSAPRPGCALVQRRLMLANSGWAAPDKHPALGNFK
jgi:hypothetical protein